MDKQEYQDSLHIITRLVEEERFEEALEVVETIDWKRVRSVNTLTMVGEIYDTNKKYKEAKEILLLAYARAPIGKNILYRLVDVALHMGDFDDAVEYYTEFCKVAQHDNSKYILKYKIYSARRSPVEEQINILETYKEREYTERWAYELATLYDKAQDGEKCVEECDDLILWFGEGLYVYKAMELKKKYAPLSLSQQAIYNSFEQALKNADSSKKEDKSKENTIDTGSSISESVYVKDASVRGTARPEMDNTEKYTDSLSGRSTVSKVTMPLVEPPVSGMSNTKASPGRVIVAPESDSFEEDKKEKTESDDNSVGAARKMMEDTGMLAQSIRSVFPEGTKEPDGSDIDYESIEQLKAEDESEFDVVRELEPEKIDSSPVSFSGSVKLQNPLDSFSLPAMTPTETPKIAAGELFEPPTEEEFRILKEKELDFDALMYETQEKLAKEVRVGDYEKTDDLEADKKERRKRRGNAKIEVQEPKTGETQEDLGLTREFNFDKELKELRARRATEAQKGKVKEQEPPKEERDWSIDRPKEPINDSYGFVAAILNIEEAEDEDKSEATGALTEEEPKSENSDGTDTARKENNKDKKSADTKKSDSKQKGKKSAGRDRARNEGAKKGKAGNKESKQDLATGAASGHEDDTRTDSEDKSADAAGVYGDSATAAGSKNKPAADAELEKERDVASDLERPKGKHADLPEDGTEAGEAKKDHGAYKSSKKSGDAKKNFGRDDSGALENNYDGYKSSDDGGVFVNTKKKFGKHSARKAAAAAAAVFAAGAESLAAKARSFEEAAGRDDKKHEPNELVDRLQDAAGTAVKGAVDDKGIDERTASKPVQEKTGEMSEEMLSKGISELDDINADRAIQMNAEKAADAAVLDTTAIVAKVAKEAVAEAKALEDGGTDADAVLQPVGSVEVSEAVAAEVAEKPDNVTEAAFPEVDKDAKSLTDETVEDIKKAVRKYAADVSEVKKDSGADKGEKPKDTKKRKGDEALEPDRRGKHSKKARRKAKKESLAENKAEASKRKEQKESEAEAFKRKEQKESETVKEAAKESAVKKEADVLSEKAKLKTPLNVDKETGKRYFDKDGGKADKTPAARTTSVVDGSSAVAPVEEENRDPSLEETKIISLAEIKAKVAEVERERREDSGVSSKGGRLDDTLDLSAQFELDKERGALSESKEAEKGESAGRVKERQAKKEDGRRGEKRRAVEEDAKRGEGYLAGEEDAKQGESYPAGKEDAERGEGYLANEEDTKRGESYPTGKEDAKQVEGHPVGKEDAKRGKSHPTVKEDAERGEVHLAGKEDAERGEGYLTGKEDAERGEGYLTGKEDAKQVEDYPAGKEDAERVESHPGGEEDAKQGEGHLAGKKGVKRAESHLADEEDAKQGESYSAGKESTERGEGYLTGKEDTKHAENYSVGKEDTKQVEGHLAGKEDAKQGEGQPAEKEDAKQGEGQPAEKEDAERGEGHLAGKEDAKQGEDYPGGKEDAERGESHPGGKEDAKRGESQPVGKEDTKRAEGYLTEKEDGKRDESHLAGGEDGGREPGSGKGVQLQKKSRKDRKKKGAEGATPVHKIEREIRKTRAFTAEEKKVFSYFSQVPGMDRQITNAISEILQNASEASSNSGNVVIMGREGSGKSKLAECIIRDICRELDINAVKTATLDADDINSQDPADIVSKLSGGFMIIERASKLTDDSIKGLDRAMEGNTDAMTVIIEDEKQYMYNCLGEHKNFAQKFSAHIIIPVFTNDELVTFGKVYCDENGHHMDEMGVLALYTLIGDNQKDFEPITVRGVKEMLDSAMAHANKFFVKLARRIARKQRDDDGYIMLYEKDFTI